MITSIWTKPGEEHPAALDIRRQVFQEELGWTPDMDQDLVDNYAYHLVLLLSDVPVATGRISFYGPGKALLSRICVLPKYRRQGIGDGLVKILDFKASTMGMKTSVVETVTSLMPFYQRIGYVKTGAGRDSYIMMEKETNDGSRENCAHQCSCEKGQG